MSGWGGGGLNAAMNYVKCSSCNLLFSNETCNCLLLGQRRNPKTSIY